MASNPPGECCRQATFHEGTPIGTHQEIFGLDTYAVGDSSSRQIVVILTDVNGNRLNNVLLIADEISKYGYRVLIPDILQGNPITPDDDLLEWLSRHTAEITAPIVDTFLKQVKETLNPEFLGGIGYCFGAKYAIQNLSSTGYLDSVAVAHPSFVSIEEVKAIKRPLIISAAEIDPIFPAELRHETEDELAKLEGVRYQVDLFSGVSHGFAVKGDIKDPIVRYAKEKALKDQLCFFETIMSEEKELPLHSKQDTTKRIRRAHHFGVLGVALITLLFVVFNYSNQPSNLFHIQAPHEPDSLCPLVTKVDPTNILHNPGTLNYILTNKKYHKKVRKNLAHAVQIPTEVYDGMQNPKSVKTLKKLFEIEPRWKPFKKFHKFLEETYPLVHKHLHLNKVNKLGLVYTWKGKSPEKKPIMLAAHQDVVPVPHETVDQWTFPPFSGGYDGKFLYGRGVSDCKNLLIGLMGTIELLLEEGHFTPERTIILAFGYDEEAAGIGAKEISEHLIDKYGPDSILQIIDEGDEGYREIEGVKFILPDTGEKGHLNSVIELFTPGGHSSVPPKHTSIGIMAQLISKIEERDFSPILTNMNPVLGQLYCVAEHSPTIDKSIKHDILKAQIDANANHNVVEYLSKDKETKFLITTSQAIDVIEGGVKSNALPEHVSIVVNSRIAVEETVDTVVNKIKGDLLEITKKFDLGLVVDGEEVVEPTANGYFNYSLVEKLEPAPISPINGESWNVFGGSLRYLYEDLLFKDTNDTFVVAPYLSSGNTDTKSYWDLTRNIYRYSPSSPTENSNIHSIDERLDFDSHFHIIAFYYYYLQVVDGKDDKLFEY
ncbi:CPS1 Carboxypeptidase S [Candida maltosa Xu316]